MLPKGWSRLAGRELLLCGVWCCLKSRWAARSMASDCAPPRVVSRPKATVDETFTFSVVFPCLASPLFLNLQRVGSKAVVHSFSRRPDGCVGPAEASGAIARGDVLVAVNGQSVRRVAFPVLVRALQVAVGEVALTFSRAPEAVLVEVGTFAGKRPEPPRVPCAPPPCPARRLLWSAGPGESVSADALKSGTVFVPPSILGRRGGLVHRHTSATDGVIRRGESRVGQKYQVATIPALRRAPRAGQEAPSGLGGRQVWSPPPASERHQATWWQQLDRLLRMYPVHVQEAVLEVVAEHGSDLVAAVDHLQRKNPSLPLGQQWRTWSAAQVSTAISTLEKHGKSLRAVARSLPGLRLPDVSSWYYAAWKRGPDYSSWKAWCAWRKRSTEVRDFHRDECCVCGQGGDLLCCDWCSLAYHVRCTGGSSLLEAAGGEGGPDDGDDWMCPACAPTYAQRGVLATAYARSFAAQEMARHSCLAQHNKGAQAWALATRAAWRRDAQAWHPPLALRAAAGGAAAEAEAVVQGVAGGGSSGTAAARRVCTFSLGGRKRARKATAGQGSAPPTRRSQGKRPT